MCQNGRVARVALQGQCCSSCSWAEVRYDCCGRLRPCHVNIMERFFAVLEKPGLPHPGAGTLGHC